MVRRHFCVLCGNKIDENLATRSSKSQPHNAIFLAALHIYHSAAQELLQIYFDEFNKTQKFICVTHFINAAQYLLAEITRNGAQLLRTADETSYISEAQIPEYLVNRLNVATRTFAEIALSVSDVARFMNFYMKRYFRSNTWKIPNVPEEQPEEDQEVRPNVPEEQPEEVHAANVVAEDDRMDNDTDGGTTPSVQRATSGASSSSHFSPSKHLESESDDERPRMKETDPNLLDRYFLVQGRKLLELFFLARCGCEVSETGVRLDKSGSSPIIYYTTKDSDKIQRWDGQEIINSGRIDKLHLGNALACIAATTTGVRMNKLEQWSTELGLELPSLSAYKRVFTELRPSIEVVYEKHQTRTIQQIRAAYEHEGCPTPWDIAVDGAFDSRGHSAELCKVLAVDLRTKLCIHTEVVSRKETGNVSGAMEKEGFRRLLRWLKSRDIPVRSISTDRSAMYGKEIESYNAESGQNIKWHLDPWHLAKYVTRNLQAATKRKSCEVLKPWIRSIKTHMYYAIEQGALTKNKEHIRHIFNGCLNHVAGIHEWSKEDITGPLTQCHHQAFAVDDRRKKPVIAKGTPAHEKLKEILLQPLFQKDLVEASSLGGTSPCETKNALDRLYCPKDIFLPPATYSIYTNMSTLHMNALKEAELRGERIVERRDIIKRKYNDVETVLRHKTPIEHLWRKEIYTAFITHRSRLPSAVPLEGT